jgi:hypothetical protein
MRFHPLERGPKLELRSFSWSRQSNYAVVEGLVRNLSDATLTRVQAVALMTDGSQQFISSNTALIEYQPLLPGQSSPFKVMVRWNPAMKSCRVEFKKLGGAKIQTLHSWNK